MIYLYKLNGNYLGYINSNNIFSRDGVFLGWIDERNLAWDGSGKFRGELKEINNNNYILLNTFTIPPIPRIPKIPPTPPTPPIPPINAFPVFAPIGYVDGF